jgi:hypothetical protein
MALFIQALLELARKLLVVFDDKNLHLPLLSSVIRLPEEFLSGDSLTESTGSSGRLPL